MVSDPRRAARELAASERRLRDVLETMRLIAVSIDRDGRIAFCNEYLAEVSGWSKEELLGRDWFGTFDPPEMTGVKEHFLGTLESGRFRPHSENWIVTRAGQRRLIAWSNTIVRDAAGDVTGATSIGEDITDRRRTEQRLLLQYAVGRVVAEATTLDESAERLLAAVGETLGWQLGVLWLAEEGGERLAPERIWTSEAGACAQLVAHTRPTRLRPGQGLPGIVWETRSPAWWVDIAEQPRFLRRAAALRDGLRGAFALPLVSGRRGLGALEFLTSRVLEPDEGLLELGAALGRQIGESIERLAAQHAVRTSEARKAAILDASLDCIVTIDHRGRVLEWNAAAERTFGFPAGEAIGRRVSELIVPPRLRPAHARGLARQLRGGPPRILGRRVELTGLRADGSEVPVELAVARVRSAGPPVFTAYIRDITERLALERERERNLESEQRLRATAEAAERRAAFLVRVGAALDAELDLAARLEGLLGLLVPELADVAVIQAAGAESGTPLRAIAGRTADGSRRVERVVDGDDAAFALVRLPFLRSAGRPLLLQGGRGEALHELAGEPEARAELLERGLRSAIAVPLAARGRPLGALAVARLGGRPYGTADLDLVAELGRRAAVALDNARLYEHQRAISNTLQRTLLPASLPTVPGLDLAAVYEPLAEGTEVGGDFYDVFAIGPDDWALAIGDVAGKGIEAAAVTGLARHTLRATANGATPPSAVLRSLNAALIREESNRFCTVALAAYRPADASLSVSLGGHPPPLLVRGGRVAALGRPALVLGALPEFNGRDVSVGLRPGDAVLFYTDGVTEAPLDRRRRFGERRLRDVLRRCDGSSAAEVAERVYTSVMDVRERGSDDMALLVAVHTGDSS